MSESSPQHKRWHWLQRLLAWAARASESSGQGQAEPAENKSVGLDCQAAALPWPGQRSLLAGREAKPAETAAPYYFIHIPKTAGTSLIAVLDRSFHQERIFPAQLWRELTPELVAQAHQYDFFRGHFGGGGLKVFPNTTPRTLTLLRDPVSLSVSTYHFVRREKETRLHRLLTDEQMTLRQFVTDARSRHLIANRQVRYLSFDIHEDPEGQDIFLSEQSQAVVRQWLPANPPRLTDAQRHERARQRLQDCVWFGLQDRFDDSLRLLAWQLGLPPIGASERLNVNPGQTRLDEATREAIVAQNQWDEKLYAWAVAEFERRMARMRQALASERHSPHDTLDDLLLRNYRRRAEARVRKAKNNRWPGQWRGDFAEPLAGSHWHRRELALPQQQWFRWTGPGRVADRWFLLQPGNYTLTLEILNGLSCHDLDQLRLRVNGQSLAYRLTRGAGSVVRQLQAFVPADTFNGSPLLRLECELPRTATHAEAFGSDDQRRVGMAVQSINWQPAPATNPRHTD